MTKDSTPSELTAGYLDVKLSRRRFGSWKWKSWRRHWVVALRSASGLELVLHPARAARPPRQPRQDAVLRLAAGSAVYRTASRSRRHAFGIATAAELDATAAGPGGEVFLAARSQLDMERWMAVIDLHNCSAPPPPRPAATAARAALLRGRRLSRSEGDLSMGLLLAALPAASPATRAAQPRTSTLRSTFRIINGRRRAETLRADTQYLTTSGSALSLLGGKIASGLISAGLGLMLSTPGGSEVEDNDLDEDDQDPELGDALDRRRESAVSVASGIYEEIRDVPAVTAPSPSPSAEGGKVIMDRLYENAVMAARRDSYGPESHYEDPAVLLSPACPSAGPQDSPASPPPLPPRQNLTPITDLLTRSNVSVDQSVTLFDSLDANGYVQMDLLRNSPICKNSMCVTSKETEPAYLPMSPIRPPSYDSQRSS